MSDQWPIEQAIAAFREASLGEEAWAPRELGELQPVLAYGSQATEPMLGLMHDEDEVVASAAAQALSEWKSDERVIQPLIALLASPAPNLRCAAALTLGDTLDVRAVEPLAALLSDNEPGVRLQAAQALGHIGTGRGWQAASSALWDTDNDVRRWAAYSLRYAGAWSVLREAVDQGAQIEADVVAEALGETGGDGAFEYLVLLLRGGPDSEERDELCQAAAEELGWSAEDVAALGEMVDSSGCEVQKKAALALGKIGDPRAVEYLRPAMDNGPWTVRLAAAEALVALGDGYAADSLLRMLGHEQDGELLEYYGAAALMDNLRDPRIDAVLTEMLTNGNDAKRCFAEIGLGRAEKRPDPKGMDLLRSLAEDRRFPHYAPLAGPLAMLPDPQGLVDAALSSTDARVRKSAAWALTQPLSPQGEQALRGIVSRRDVDAAAGAYSYLVGCGLRESEGMLLNALAFCGHKAMAEDFVGCGNVMLAEAGRAWLGHHPRENYMEWQPWGLPASPVWGEGIG